MEGRRLATKRRTALIVAGCLLLTLVGSLAADAADRQRPERLCSPAPVVNLLTDDMQGRHEARMHGVPSDYDWADGPRLGWGNEPPADWSAITAWGQVYEAAGGSRAANVRVEVRHIAIHVRSRQAGRWTRVQASRGVDGAAYVEDFQGDVSRKIHLRRERGGGVSARLIDGYNFHFWPTVDRAGMDPTDIAGVVARFDARLILDRPNGPNELRRARLLASAGGDYWRDKTAEWDNWETNGDFAIGKARFVTPAWQTYTASTIGEDELRADPPPFCVFPDR